LLRWIADGAGGPLPPIGSIPNHFVIEIDGAVDEPSAVAAAAESALRAAWKKICGGVWGAFVERPSAKGLGTREIWERQTGGFWEFTWAAGPEKSRGLLDRRKQWRTHRLPDEPGDKCTVMPELQELSGHLRARGRSAREAQDAFWEEARAGRGLGPLDLRDNERLSAVALVKRLYPKIAEAALGGQLDTSHWQSTVYLGALPWVREVAVARPQDARRFAEQVRASAGDVLAEKVPTLAGEACADAGDFARLDANYYHRAFLGDPRLCPLGLVDEAQQEARRRRLLAGLDELRKAVGSAPATHYAILLADGDKLGDLVQKLGGKVVGEALARFTVDAPKCVRACDGVTVYAGGDDVLAMLPVPRALECAEALATAYSAAFQGVGATLSAAVVFVHVRLPLRSALDEARRLLDDVAKEENNRDSLAVGVLKRGGLHCQWTTTWRWGDGSAVARLGEFVGALKGDDQAEVGFSASLLHRMHATLGLLAGWPQWRPGLWARTLPGLDVQAFLGAEIKRSFTARGADVDAAPEQADALTAMLADLLPRRRREDGSKTTADAGLEVGVDVLLLARFLATGGAEEDA
ncbi:MAG TPA: type III-B CRISPR-associated protein Cas10/Cmr2, partial [Nannocystaceae bacterium]|nr:type III-B CRISPR-associated protein Cas10/Cmr2 [Nannocystaceae bacterium]